MARFTKIALLVLVGIAAFGRVTAPVAGAGETTPALTSIGPLTFAPDGTLYAADTNAATIYALDLGSSAQGAAAGTANVPGLDQKLAAMLGTGVADVRIADLA